MTKKQAAVIEAAQHVLEASHDTDLPGPLRGALNVLEARLVQAGYREWAGRSTTQAKDPR